MVFSNLEITSHIWHSLDLTSVQRMKFHLLKFSQHFFCFFLCFLSKIIMIITIALFIEFDYIMRYRNPNKPTFPQRYRSYKPQKHTSFRHIFVHSKILIELKIYFFLFHFFVSISHCIPNCTNINHILF